MAFKKESIKIGTQYDLEGTRKDDIVFIEFQGRKGEIAGLDCWEEGIDWNNIEDVLNRINFIVNYNPKLKNDKR